RPFDILDVDDLEPRLVVLTASGFVTDHAIDLQLSSHEHAGQLRVLGVDLLRFARATARIMPREHHEKIKITQANFSRLERAWPASIGERDLGVRGWVSENPWLAWPARLDVAPGRVEVPAPANGLIFVALATGLGCGEGIRARLLGLALLVESG